jgi:hypothetical protein
LLNSLLQGPSLKPPVWGLEANGLFWQNVALGEIAGPTSV